MRGFLLVVFDGRGELVQEGEVNMASSSDIMKKQK